MSKKFATKKEFDNWITEYNKKFNEGKDLFQQLSRRPSEDMYIGALVSEGYTDLYDLIEDGHAYEIGGYKNNGWYYRDELDKYFLNIPEERIRDR